VRESSGLFHRGRDKVLDPVTRALAAGEPVPVQVGRAPQHRVAQVRHRRACEECDGQHRHAKAALLGVDRRQAHGLGRGRGRELEAGVVDRDGELHVGHGEDHAGEGRVEAAHGHVEQGQPGTVGLRRRRRRRRRAPRPACSLCTPAAAAPWPRCSAGAQMRARATPGEHLHVFAVGAFGSRAGGVPRTVVPWVDAYRWTCRGCAQGCEQEQGCEWYEYGCEQLGV